ncbi:MAG: class II fructose-bisphosphate aldolase, partial [Propionibacteriaceae bacterium]|nr:class II fructose-bisphosphate aldolase [Propionibacteriaceae bacterium]
RARMPVVSLQEIVGKAMAEGYGVPAINIFNDMTLQGVLDGAVRANSPVIVQTSVKTVKAIGSQTLKAMWDAMTRDIPVPVTLHLDHCPDRAVISECLEVGWNSVLFDASELPVEENQRQTVEVVAEARRYGAHVEGEIESITGVEDGIGSDEEAARQPLDVVLTYLDATGVDVFAPAIGNAHGRYKQAPVLDFDRVRDIVEARGIPIALHGGSGLTDDDFNRLIKLGCAKVNLSTALKETYLHGMYDALKAADAAGKWEPLNVFKPVEAAIVDFTATHCELFGSAGKA